MPFKRPNHKCDIFSSPGLRPAPFKRVRPKPRPASSPTPQNRDPVLHDSRSQCRSNDPTNLSCNPKHSSQTSRNITPIANPLDDIEFTNDIILALDLRARDAVGAAYYSSQDSILFLLSDVKFGGLPVIEQLKSYVQPNVILVPSRIDELVDEQLNPARERRARSAGVAGSIVGVAGGENSDDHWTDPWVLEVRPSAEFNFDTGKRKLGELRLRERYNESVFAIPSDGNGDVFEVTGRNVAPGFTGRQGKVLRLAGKIDLESELSVGCAGAVLTYLNRRRAVAWQRTEDGDEMSWSVKEVEMFRLDGTMFLNSDALSSLSIFQSESHPHSHNQGPTNSSGSKEDISVYGLFGRLSKTPQGKYLLRQYFLRPSLDLEVINERQNTLSVFLRPDNEHLLPEIVKSLKSIKNMRTVMVHLRKGMSNGVSRGAGIKNGAWTSLRSFAFHALGILDSCKKMLGSQRLGIIHKISEVFDAKGLKTVGRLVTETINFSESIEMHRTVVNQGLDELLDELKRVYSGIEDLLGKASRTIADSIPQRYALNLNVVFFPQIGFLISMPADPNTGRAEWEGDTDRDGTWERIFSTPDRVYYKDSHMRGLDKNPGDVYAHICDREIDIIHDLASRVLEYEQMLCSISDTCGELDSLIALAQGARMYKLVRPVMTSSNVVDIQNGRHLLQELTVPACIGNDAYLVGGTGDLESKPDSHKLQGIHTAEFIRYKNGPSTLIMTGPNYSGKSIYLKQTSLIIYLAHIGSFVPADQATIGITDKILTRVTSRETVSKTQSAFMIDLQQIALAINVATRRSLVVIDEFGKGTNAVDGAGLVCGVFEYLLALRENCPKVIGATHFHEIFENGFLEERTGLAFGHLDVRIDKNASEVENQVTYLYSMQPGRSLASFGTLCASLNGVDKAVVNRAQDLVILVAKGGDLVASCAGISNEELKTLNNAEDIARRFLAQDFSEPYDELTGTDCETFLKNI